MTVTPSHGGMVIFWKTVDNFSFIKGEFFYAACIDYNMEYTINQLLMTTFNHRCR
jgi:hypothetical protein